MEVLKEWLEYVLEWYRSGSYTHFIRAGIVLLIGISLSRALASLAGKLTRNRISRQGQMVIRKVILYTGMALTTVMVLSEFGFQLTTVLGAAGVAGVAIGFAAQTSLSNVISGFFLIGERPFEVGDIIKIGDRTGTVESVDLLSMTMRTFDNLSVRIPNEMLVKTPITNITRHPIRRFDITLGVDYKEDVDHVLDVLREVAEQNPEVLEEPAPLIAITGTGESELQFFVGAWYLREDFISMRNTLLRDILKRFKEEEIGIPYPHRVILSADGQEKR